MRSENRRIMINDAIQREVNRRSFLGSTSVGVGAAALSGLIGAELTAKGLPAGSADTPHHPPQVPLSTVNSVLSLNSGPISDAMFTSTK